MKITRKGSFLLRLSEKEAKQLVDILASVEPSSVEMSVFLDALYNQLYAAGVPVE